MLDTPLLTVADLCTASGATPAQVHNWIRLGLITPARTTAPGVAWGFDDLNILQASQWVELAKAGLSGRQMQAIAARQQAALSDLSPRSRLIRQFEFYIEVVVTLAAVFGRGEGYDNWLARQQKQLALMKRDLTPDGRASRRSRLEERRTMLRLFVAAQKARRTAAAPLAS